MVKISNVENLHLHSKPDIAFSPKRPRIDPNKLSIWAPGQLRLFISHRDEYRGQATELAQSLKPFGISSFVAHYSIEAMSQWQRAIVEGLETMEVALAFITDDFYESVWTTQEIGFALGRNVPVISLKLQDQKPCGFVGDIQALHGNLRDPASSACAIHRIIADDLGLKNRLQVS
ncbi:MAG: toll/interleukin-1 receptor domain-containing protein [Hyphomicrobiaceae bacterium]